jgi:hypothetical protein
VQDGGLKFLQKNRLKATETVGQCDLVKSPSTNRQIEPKI